MKQLVGVILLNLLITLPLGAQDAEEIIVTASRISNYQSDTIPVVNLRRKADFMVVESSIESDSRSAKLRATEVEKTLKSLVASASRADHIELGLTKTFETDDQEIEYVIPFVLEDVEVSSGYRQDTSQVRFIIKTPINESDEDPELVFGRIMAFIESVKEEGRAVVSDADEPNLSLVNIGQYRAPLLQAIAADNAELRKIFGEGYEVAIGGLEEPVRWRVVGPMQVAVYFPYYSSIAVD